MLDLFADLVHSGDQVLDYLEAFYFQQRAVLRSRLPSQRLGDLGQVLQLAVRADHFHISHR